MGSTGGWRGGIEAQVNNERAIRCYQKSGFQQLMRLPEHGLRESDVRLLAHGGGARALENEAKQCRRRPAPSSPYSPGAPDGRIPRRLSVR